MLRTDWLNGENIINVTDKGKAQKQKITGKSNENGPIPTVK